MYQTTDQKPFNHPAVYLLLLSNLFRNAIMIKNQKQAFNSNRNLNMLHVTYSVNKIPIRITAERWSHIVENHDDIAGYYYDVLETVNKPTWVFDGDEDELWAVKLIPEKKAILVIYREFKEQNDGFIITAFFTKKIKKLLKRKILWQQHQ